MGAKQSIRRRLEYLLQFKVEPLLFPLPARACYTSIAKFNESHHDISCRSLCPVFD